MKIISLSGGNFQFSSHPELASIDVKDAANKITATSHEWDIKDLTTLDSFVYDPRNTGCTAHVQRQGGLLGAKLEHHNDKEISIVTQLDPSPMRVTFLSSQDAKRFTELIELTTVCCQTKFNASLGEAVEDRNKVQVQE